MWFFLSLYLYVNEDLIIIILLGEGYTFWVHKIFFTNLIGYIFCKSCTIFLQDTLIKVQSDIGNEKQKSTVF